MSAPATGLDPRTLPGMLAQRARETPAAAAFHVKRGDRWEPVSWADFERGTLRVAQALATRGVAHGDRVGILGPTSIAWEYLQMGALRMGAVVVGIDANYADDTLQALLRAQNLAALGVTDDVMLARVPDEVRGRLKVVAGFEAAPSSGMPSLSVAETVACTSASLQPDALPPPPGRDDAAITVYSSGTTGSPKPITYTHGQVAIAVDAIVGLFPDIGPGSRFACWLPLANLFQRIIDFCAIRIGATSYIVSDPRALVAELPAIAPAILIGVPRFYERLHAGINAEVNAATGLRGSVARWALGLARRRALGAATALDRVAARLADALVYARIRAMFGPNLRYLISGSAPMARWLLAWYETLGLPVYEAYGVSEDIVPVAMNRSGARRSGTVGQPLPGNEVRLADDGEILVRGPGVSADAAGTAGTDGGRYWPTGDLGRFDRQGFLSVTGRKTDVFKSADGRWIVPQQIEAALRSIAYIEHPVVLGAGRQGVVAVVTVNWDALISHAAARGVNACAAGRRELTADGRRLLQEDFAHAAAPLPANERPRALIVAGHDFSIEGGELTTNLKLRRLAIESRFQPQLDAAYSALESAPGARPLVLSCA